MINLTLLYHRVCQEEADRGLLCVSPKNFSEQLAVLNKHSARSDVYGNIICSGRGKKISAHITFDDGYKDNLDAALPCLSAWDWPATFFVATGRNFSVGNFWWITMEHLCRELNLGPHRLGFSTGGKEWHFDFSRSKIRERASYVYAALSAVLHNADRITQERLMHWLLSQSSDPTCTATRKLVLNEAEIEQLAASSLITIGAHTVNHLKLSLLSSADMVHELGESRLILERIIGRKVEVVSYPFGRREDINAKVLKVAEGLGFKGGFVNWTEPFFFSGSTYARRRLLVRNWTGAEFEDRLLQYMRFGVWRWK